jgi:Tol biopolymer transport system component
VESAVRRLILLVVLVALICPAGAPARSRPRYGGKIVYTYDSPLRPTFTFSVRAVSGDAKVDRQLVSAQDVLPAPTLSPNGRTLAYVRDDGTLVVRSAAPGRHRARVVFDPPGDAVAGGGSWSPDGRQLITSYFSRIAGPPQGSAGKLFLIRADGSGQRELQTAFGTACVGWEPDGKRIQILPGDAFDRPAIWTFDLATGAQTKVIDVRPDWLGISLSPSRRWLAYVDRRIGGRIVRYTGLWAIRRDGSRRRKISGSTPARRAFETTWSPDGRAIAFIPSYRRPPGQRDVRDIYRVNFTGRGLRRLTHRGHVLSADWGPGNLAKPRRRR